MNNFAFNVERISNINPETGDIAYSYIYKNESCITEIIDTRLEKQYVAYDLIHHDLVCAKEWIELAHKILPPRSNGQSTKNKDQYGPMGHKEKETIIQSLFISSVTYYGKCFTQAKGRGVKLDKAFVPSEFNQKHDQIMEFRHTIAAHSGNGPWDVGVLKLVKSPNGDLKPFVWSELKMLSFCDDSEDEYKYIDLLHALIERVLNKIENLGKRILKETNGN